MFIVSGSVMVYNKTWLKCSLDYADKTQLATTTERRVERSRHLLFRVPADCQVHDDNDNDETVVIITIRVLLYQ